MALSGLEPVYYGAESAPEYCNKIVQWPSRPPIPPALGSKKRPHIPGRHLTVAIACYRQPPPSIEAALKQKEAAKLSKYGSTLATTRRPYSARTWREASPPRSSTMPSRPASASITRPARPASASTARSSSARPLSQCQALAQQLSQPRQLSPTYAEYGVEGVQDSAETPTTPRSARSPKAPPEKFDSEECEDEYEDDFESEYKDDFKVEDQDEMDAGIMNIVPRSPSPEGLHPSSPVCRSVASPDCQSEKSSHGIRDEKSIGSERPVKKRPSSARYYIESLEKCWKEDVPYQPVLTGSCGSPRSPASGSTFSMKTNLQEQRSSPRPMSAPVTKVSTSSRRPMSAPATKASTCSNNAVGWQLMCQDSDRKTRLEQDLFSQWLGIYDEELRSERTRIEDERQGFRSRPASVVSCSRPVDASPHGKLLDATTHVAPAAEVAAPCPDLPPAMPRKWQRPERPISARARPWTSHFSRGDDRVSKLPTGPTPATVPMPAFAGDCKSDVAELARVALSNVTTDTTRQPTSRPASKASSDRMSIIVTPAAEPTSRPVSKIPSKRPSNILVEDSATKPLAVHRASTAPDLAIGSTQRLARASSIAPADKPVAFTVDRKRSEGSKRKTLRRTAPGMQEGRVASLRASKRLGSYRQADAMCKTLSQIHQEQLLEQQINGTSAWQVLNKEALAVIACSTISPAAVLDGRWKAVFERLARDAEVHRDQLQIALELGSVHQEVTPELLEAALEIAGVTYSTLNLNEFCRFVQAFHDKVRQEHQEAFHDCDPDEHGRVDRAHLENALEDIQVKPMQYVWHEIMQEIGLRTGCEIDNGLLNFDQFEQAMEIVTERQGFSIFESNRLVKAFHAYDRDNSGSLDCSEVEGVLDYLYYSLDRTTAMKIVNDSDLDGSGEINLKEFMVIMRKIRERELAKIKLCLIHFGRRGSLVRNQLVQECQVDKKCKLEQVMKMLGYLPDLDAMAQAAEDVGLKIPVQHLHVDTTWKFLEIFRHREGFTREDAVDLQTIFNKFAEMPVSDSRRFSTSSQISRRFSTSSRSDQVGRDGEIELQLPEWKMETTLRWLGYAAPRQARLLIIADAELDAAGGLYFAGFKKLVRKFREQKLDKHRREMRKSDEGMDGAPSTRSEAREFEIHERRTRKTFRNNEGFSPDEVAMYQDMFNKYDADGGGELGREEIRIVFEELAPDLSTSQKSRPALLKLLDEVDDGDGLLGFHEFLALMRRFHEHKSRAELLEEERAASAAKMDEKEVQAFRRMFVAVDEDGEDFLTFAQIRNMLVGIIPMGERPMMMLRKMWHSVVPETGEQANICSFPNFLRLMRCLIDNPIAGAVAL